ncbi:MAG: ATP-binding cassette domain-containing protein [Actinophytocola sp.]|uniref:ABC transporter ATP-binding protein n=1 Tax=Actinophytocola sp. TaxID=1872138 RepID=UPI0013220447|nr:ABC transporter ATP-binding protein [Actinophytocola sp.]MPZ79137.1 ATP-binding cassette domain-containing protein [Actinophytocola sp.]
MQDGSGRIVVQNLSKNFGQVAAVQNLSFQVEPGSVTGFLGPNGAGKTTTLRMLLGLVTPTAGFTTVNGQPYHHLGNPARVVGAVLEAQGFHPSRTARNHLRVYAAAMGVPDQRADEVLNLVGLGSAGDRGAGGFSLGMKQRLALATALLGDPQVLVLDEPANGLDPEGIAWLRTFLKAFASSGRTVLISSHLLAEVEQTIDQVVIISRGQTMYYGMLDDLRKSQQSRVIVQPADPTALVDALRAAEIGNVQPLPDGKIAVVGATVQQIGDVAAKAGVALYGVQEERADLEQLFFRLTSGQYAAPGQVPHGQLPPVPPGGYAQPVPQPGQYQQQPQYQPGQQSGYPTPPQPPQGYPPQQPGYQQQPQPGYPPQQSQQPQQGTPPGGWGPPPNTPPGGWGLPGGPQQQQQPAQQQPTPPPGYEQPGQGGGLGGNA